MALTSSRSLKDRFASGARWTVALRLVDRGLGFASTLLLARLLTPEDFGVVAMGTSIQAILLAVTEFGFIQSLIQRSDTDNKAYDTAWTLLIIANAIVSLILVALIPLALRWYDDPRVVPVMVALAFHAFLSSFRNVGYVLYEREMNFRPAFLMALWRKIASVLVAASAAYVLGNYWALLAGVLAGVVTEVAVSYWLFPYRPRFSLARTSELMGFSKWWLASQLTGHLNRRGQDFLIGGQLGAERLGQYSVAFEFATLPTTEIVAPLTRAVLPGYVMLRENSSRMFGTFARVWGGVALVALPAAAGIFCLSELITKVILGPKWAGTEGLLGLLAFLGAAHAMSTNFWPLVLTLKGPKASFILAVVSLILTMPAFVALLILQGLTAAVLGLIGSSVLVLVLTAAWFVHTQGLAALSLLRPLVRPALSTLVMVATLLAGPPYAAGDANWAGDFVNLLARVALGAVVYTISIAFLWLLSGCPAGAERDFYDVLPIPTGWRQ